MRMRLLLPTLVLLAGCGGDEPASSTSEATSTPAPAAEERSADEREVAEVAQAYIDGFSRQDWKAVCETRTRKEQKDLARLAGSCEKAFAAIAKEKPASVTLFEDAEVGDVKVDGDRATAEIVQEGQTEAATDLVAVRDGDRWALISSD